jgi:hypothetical protein
MENPILYDRFWFELYNAKFKEEYFTMFLSKRFRTRSILDAVVVIASVIGVSGFQFDGRITFVAAIVTATVSVLSACVPSFTPRESELADISNTVVFYSQYVTSIERLYMHYFCGEISNKEAETEFYRLQGEIPKVEAVVNHFLHRNISRISAEADKKAKTYVDEVFKSI